ncbi:TAXI family TRAP transporter solute-binding subunit [Lignipirellula cremea]|uniref:NMT1/THI5 like protein n=1 Tax=Lignipirellula cremea TaxID=2528010 RepID=A0A518DSI4_9BACT|nr:TAXI family TRAP transporter solute-binding subunit [Lignipirellula cremea]QDU94748.1 NMT1/THI5 like protein [Lignipirellula cremea]
MLRTEPWSRRALALLLGVVLLSSGCSSSSTPGDSDGRQNFLTIGTAPAGGAFYVVGGAIAEVLNEHPGELKWKAQPKGTKGSQENIRRLDKGELQLALSNAAITYFAVRGEAGWEKKYDTQAVMTLAPNVALFIAKKDSGILTMADLKGKKVSIGPSGAGFEMFVEPILKAHGLSMDDITKVNSTQTNAVDQLGDGVIDAAFLGGAVPTSSIVQAASSAEITYIPFDEDARQKLIAEYEFFHPATIPADTYKGMTDDFEGLNVGSMHLVTAGNASEELIYEITKTLWENREEVAKKHPAGKAINPKNAARKTGTPFHPGAIRFYKEAGIWEDGAAKADAGDAPAADAPAPAADAPAAG